MTYQPYVVGSHVERDELPRSRRLAVLALLLGIVGGVLLADVAKADEPERYEPNSRGGVRATITERAEANGVSGAALVALAECESRLDPGAVGDHGHSHGLVQLSDLPGTGLLWDFYRRGYTDPYDTYQAADYLAHVAAGDFPGIRLSRWMCYRMQGGW